MSEVVSLMVEGKVATLSFNRPECMNSYDMAMSEQLLEATEWLEANQEINIVILKGQGEAFMAGGDIRFFADRLEQMPQGVKAIIRRLASTVHNMRQSNKLFVAVVHGAVAGAGLSLMLACDLVLAREDTVFTTAYSRLGTSPDGGLSYFLPRLVGEKKAMELLLLADRFDAKEAYKLGLINRVLPLATFEQDIITYLAKVSNLPSLASQRIKELIYASHNNSLADQLELEAKHFVEATQTQNFTEGVKAFLEKRRPNFD